VEKGVARLTLNGRTLEGNLIPAEALEARNTVEVRMG
jgi:hypothetical protein